MPDGGGLGDRAAVGEPARTRYDDGHAGIRDTLVAPGTHRLSGQPPSAYSGTGWARWSGSRAWLTASATMCAMCSSVSE